LKNGFWDQFIFRVFGSSHWIWKRMQIFMIPDIKNLCILRLLIRKSLLNRVLQYLLLSSICKCYNTGSRHLGAVSG
jgi:hypothetical protein